MVRREVLPVLKANKKGAKSTGEATPTKIGLHVFHINLYLHKFFESIQFFGPHGLYSMFRREILAVFEGKQKGPITPVYLLDKFSFFTKRTLLAIGHWFRFQSK